MKNPSLLHHSLGTAVRSDARNHGSPVFKHTLWVCGTVLLAILAILHPLVGNALARENGPIEVLQFGLLTTGFLMLAWNATRSSAARPGLLLFSLLYLTLALRELDLRHSVAPDWLVQLTLHQRHLWLTPLWLIVVVSAVIHRDEIKRWTSNLNWSVLKPLIGLMVGLYTASFVFENHLIFPKGAVATFWEETAELLLAVSMVAFAHALSLRAETRRVARPDYEAVRLLN